MKIEPGTVRADGAEPSAYEATALAALALIGEPKAPIAELGATLLGGYAPWHGWGDGRANMVVLRAVSALFKDPPPSDVRVVLERDGKPVVEGTLNGERLKDVVTLEATSPGSSGKHRWTVRADPPRPGLAFAMSLVAWVPWKDEPGAGLELVTKWPGTAKVGEAATVGLSVATPPNLATTLRLALPAGFQADGPSLAELVAAERITRFELEDGAVVMHLPPARGVQSWEGSVRVVPTLAGTLQTGASELAPEGRPTEAHPFAPRTLRVR